MIMTLVSKGANGIWEHALLDSSSKSGKHRKPKPHHPVHPNKYDFITAKYKQQLFVHRSGKEHDQLPTDDLSQVCYHMHEVVMIKVTRPDLSL
jgi:hypothetical protein